MGQKLINKLGHRYGFLTVIEKAKDKNNRTAWRCKCDCGNEVIIRGPDLRKGKYTTCGKKGCIYAQGRGTFIDETGNQYGLLTVLYRNGSNTSNKVLWHCKCSCGNECDVVGSDLRSKKQISCGCIKSKREYEITQILLENNINFKKEYSFQNLFVIDKFSPLRFDFAIFNKEKLILLIEFQGNQHFYPVEVFGGLEEFNKRIYRDKLKKEYCNKNNIPLLILTENNKNNLKELILNKINDLWEI